MVRAVLVAGHDDAGDLDGERGDEFAAAFATDIARHRAWERTTASVPA